mmetsp:Transcript_30745/g.40880  ORF Transcript_30745/g.40880 Transcript_30745/m.40880 type:complete len:100 (+) Transcript_30745:112-411(+)
MKDHFSCQSQEFLVSRNQAARQAVTTTVKEGEIFEDSLRVTRANFHQKETNAEYYAMQSKMKKYRKIGDSLVHIKMDDSYHSMSSTKHGDFEQSYQQLP